MGVVEIGFVGMTTALGKSIARTSSRLDEAVAVGNGTSARLLFRELLETARNVRLPADVAATKDAARLSGIQSALASVRDVLGAHHTAFDAASRRAFGGASAGMGATWERTRPTVQLAIRELTPPR